MVRPVIHAQSTNVTYILAMYKQDEMVRQVINQQKVTYILKMHKQDRKVIHAQSTKDHLQPENAQMKKDGQTGHSGSIKKRSHTFWKCTSKARWSLILNQKRSQTFWKCTNKVEWSDRSFMLNQQGSHTDWKCKTR